MIDNTDLEILALLQDNARISNAEIARQVGMAPSGTLERVRKLEERGVITGYHAHLAPEALGVGVAAFVFVRTADGCGSVDTGRQLADTPEILEVHHVAGEDCLLLKIRAADTRDLARVLRERIGVLDGVRDTRTTIVLETLRENGSLPLPAVSPARSPRED